MLFTVLPVGQGTGTLIEVIDDATKIPSTVVVVDLGSIGDFKAAGLMSCQVVIEELEKMPFPTLDALFVSHADDDHLNLIPILLNAFNKPSGPIDPAKKTLMVNNVWYGGEEKEYGNFLNTLKQYKPLNKRTNIHHLRYEYSNMAQPIFGKDGVEIFTLIANTICEETYVAMDSGTLGSAGGGYLRNTASLVLMVSYGTQTQRRFITTGDATCMTMAACIQRLTANERKGRLFKPVLSISLPHHGSASTTYDVLRATAPWHKTPDRTAQEVVDSFVDFLQPESVTVSAGEITVYRHPSPRVIKDFAVFAKDAAKAADKGSPVIWEQPIVSPDHFYTAYFTARQLAVVQDPNVMDTGQNPTSWPKSEGWWSARTTKAVYTTEYFVKSSLPPAANIPRAFPPDAKFLPPDGPYGNLNWVCGWEYTVSQNGTKVALSNPYGLPPGPLKLDAEDNMEAGPALQLRSVPLAQPVHVPAPVVLRGATQPRAAAAARVPWPRRRQVRPLP
jgi:beta-lactamase superfamily II metal-dependent hydrolase